MVPKVFYDVSYAKSWRIGFGATSSEAMLNIVAHAVRIGDTWTMVGTRSRPVMGIDSNRRVTIEFDPEGGSVIEVLGSEDLKTWEPATASSRFFKSVQEQTER